MGMLATADVLRDLTLVLNPSYEAFSPGSYEDILSSLECSLLSTQFVKIHIRPPTSELTQDSLVLIKLSNLIIIAVGSPHHMHP